MSNPETPVQAAEAAAIRRRWITLGEIVAVLAVVISGLTFWNSYQERQTAEADRAAQKQEARTKKQLLVLRATPERDGKRLRLAAASEEQLIQKQVLRFPTELGAAPIETVSDPRVEARWIEAAARKAAEAKVRLGSGDRRLPVAITTSFVSGGETESATALYDVAYKSESSLLGGTDVELKGLSLMARTEEKNAQRRLDGAWAARGK